MRSGCDVAMETDQSSGPKLEKKYYIDSTYITVPREEMEVLTPIRDSMGEREGGREG